MHIQTPKIFHRLFPQLLWKVNVTSKVIYLTFDDGPHPEITPKVLNILADYDAKAAFFCVGDNVQKYPKTFRQIVEAGHVVGNHTFHHLKGWRTPDDLYFQDVAACQKLVKADFFRPPYGRIKPSQIRELGKQYLLVMWSVISYDYDRKISPDHCLRIATKNTGPGDIVVFHDSEKAAKNMLHALPRFLEYFSKRGYRFERLMNW
jgi:peptidoglycan/xylan/chitin deacetylase (PgdA/CDA1 family)